MTAEIAALADLIGQYGAFPVLAAWFHFRLQTVEETIGELQSHMIAADGGEETGD